MSQWAWSLCLLSIMRCRFNLINHFRCSNNSTICFVFYHKNATGCICISLKCYITNSYHCLRFELLLCWYWFSFIYIYGKTINMRRREHLKSNFINFTWITEKKWCFSNDKLFWLFYWSRHRERNCLFVFICGILQFGSHWKCWSDKNSCRWAIHLYFFRIVRPLFFYWWWLEPIVISFGTFVCFVCAFGGIGESQYIWARASDSFIALFFFYFFFHSLLAVSFIFNGRYCFFLLLSFLQWFWCLLLT